jgi:hypothetical protein
MSSEDLNLRATLDAAGIVSGSAQATAALQRLQASVSASKSEILEATSAHERMASGLESLSGGLERLAAVAGIGLSVEGLAETVTKMGELGETAVNTAASIGISASQFMNLSESMQVIGGDGSTLIRTLRQVDNALRAAASNPLSKQADAFRELGISAEEMQRGLTHPIEMLNTLADAYKRLGGAGGEGGPFGVILQRQIANLIPYLKDGSEGIARLSQMVKDLGAPSEDTIHKLAEMGESVNKLEIAFKNLGITIVDKFNEPLSKSIEAMSGFIAGTTKFLNQVPGDTIHGTVGRRVPILSNPPLVGTTSLVLADTAARFNDGCLTSRQTPPPGSQSPLVPMLLPPRI